MSDTQVVRLKKEIELLREHNVQLKMQVEEQAEQLGQMEYQHLNIMNKNLMLQEEKKIAEDSSRLEKIISAALIDEKQKTENYKNQCQKLTKDLNYCIDQIKSNEIYLTKLAAADPVKYIGDEKPEHALTGVVDGIEIFLPLAGLIDVDKEIMRLQKELDKLNDSIKLTQNKLKNEKFISKAPENVVQAERDKLAATNEKIKSIEARIKSFK